MARRLQLIVLLGLTLLVAWYGLRRYAQPDPLAGRLKSLVAVRPADTVACTTFTHARPLVLLVLGQSNAGNHGSLSATGDAPVAVQAGTQCALANDPLPGATSQGGSIWRHLPALLQQQAAGRTVVLSVLAVDATSIDDWTRPGSPIAQRLVAQVQVLQQSGMAPDFVLWQQGEADARVNTAAAAYLAGLNRLAALLSKAGVGAPVMLAHSTVCGSGPDAAVRSAVEQATKTNPRFLQGPDTDLLGDAYRRDGCHFNAEGLRLAAQAWAVLVRQRL